MSAIGCTLRSDVVHFNQVDHLGGDERAPKVVTDLFLHEDGPLYPSRIAEVPARLNSHV